VGVALQVRGTLCDRLKLRTMRNEIFARYGYIFKSEGLKNHISQSN
jgi:hypothetical protein